MANENLGASFSIDVGNLKAGLAQANRLIRESESEFKAAAAGLDDWSKSQTGLEAKLKSLNSITEIQRKKVDALQSQYDELIAGGLDPASKQATELRTKINNETAALNKNEKAIGDTQKALDELANEAGEAADATKETGDAAKKAGDGFTVGKGAIASFIGNGLTALVGAAKNAVSSLLGLAESTREFRDDMAKLDTAFETSGHSTETARKSYEDFYAILGESDRSVEAVNHLAELTSNEQELAKWSDIAAGVTAKFGDSLPIEGLTEAANETAKVGKVTGPLADALNWAGVSEDEFNKKLEECNSEQERATLITDTLNGIYKEAADEYNNTTKSTQDARRATAELEQAQADLGATVEPITTKFTELKTQALQWFIDTGLPALQSAFQWLSNNLPVVATVIGGVTTAMVAQKIASIAATAATEGMTLAQYAAAAAQRVLNVAMNANPIGIIITLISALVAAFMYLWDNCEGFRNFFIQMWEGIKSAFSAVVNFFKTALEKIKNFFSQAWQGIKKAWSGVTQFFSGIWQKITGVFSGVASFFSGIFKRAWEGIKNAFSSVKSFFSGIWQKIKSAFKFGDMLSIGKNVIEGLWNGIKNSVAWIKEKITGWVGDVMSFIKRLFGIKSPSRVMRDEVGVMLARGIGVGFEKGMQGVKADIKNSVAGISGIGADISVNGKGTAAAGGVVVYQTNNYAQAHSRYEIYQSKKEAAAAVRLAMEAR